MSFFHFPNSQARSLSLSLCPLPGMHPAFLLTNPCPLLGLSSDTSSFLPKSFKDLRGHVPLCASSFRRSEGPFFLCLLTSQGKDMLASLSYSESPVQCPAHRGLEGTLGKRQKAEVSMAPFFGCRVGCIAGAGQVGGEDDRGRSPTAPQLTRGPLPAAPGR